MEIYFTKEHEWVKVKEGVALVGITEHAAHQLGDVTFVELPKVGKVVKQFEVLAAIESVKAASDIYAPVSGTVTQVNEALEERPEIVNEAAEDAGWMAIMDMEDPAELQKLMTRDQYDEYVRSLG
ncbi:glycine cleavage system H protein [Geobacter metallireducens RCH3]|uniref:Glycine cleavage system H protein n=1 Tax=Geobacter metallireducens (strain ATCC 53774 / DSM 7210 / GS-15) TaxID=269799 RepID=Q39QV7_GEOMG|nr:glycine cleavage system protein GcvH [Geobacter metallireducens]ABB33367.1 glycine cleavage system lipoyl carrier protein GcvH [Geobacter metallireducens GS-15]EHP85432.1 glycine cleavage system H protein [Geobacter metallireducens RCH3]